MKLTNKQIRFLKSKAQTQKAIFQIGKGGLSDNLLDGLDKALEAHELVKVHLLQTFDESIDATIIDITTDLNCHFVQKIGRMLIFYRKSKKPKLELPRG